MDIQTRVQAYRECAQVNRCHLFRYHGEYTVGQHTFDALSLLLALNPGASRNLILAVMFHDFPERWKGDMPGNVLRSNEELNRLWMELESDIISDKEIPDYESMLTPEERPWVRAVDVIELWLWCHDQIALGNSHVQDMLDRVTGWLVSMRVKGILPEPAAKFIGNYVWKRTKEYGDR